MFFVKFKPGMLKPLLLFSLLLSVSFSDAQLKKITGLVTFNNERMSGAIIKNLSAHIRTISNDRGEFGISAQTGDTLITIREGYIKDTLFVTNQPYLIVKLRKNPLLLKEVVINSTPISPESAYEANKKDYKDIYVKGDKSKIILPGSIFIGMGIGVSLNINKLYNALSKQGKDARSLQHTLTKDYKNSIIDKRFNPLAARITGYKDKLLSDFIQDNRPTYEIIKNATDYDITQYIKSKLAEEKISSKK
jgi:hypothetical protein